MKTAFFKKILKILFLTFIVALVLITCEKPKREMLVKTGEVTNITVTSAEVGGIIVDAGENATQYGHCYSKNQTPTINDSRTLLKNTTQKISISPGSFKSTLTKLEAGTKYYVRAYIKDEDITVYGDIISFTTNSISLPQLSTNEVTLITQTTASGGGNVTSDGGGTVTARGVCWSTSQNPTTANSKTTDGSGTGSFVSSLTGLTPNTTYYVRAYATNSAGTAYGNQVSFTTQVDLPTVTTTSISNITTTTATGGGNVTSDGGATVTARGVCWSTSQNPTIANSKTTDGSGTGSFVSSLTGLTPNTTYYVRAYATNSAGTAYGNQVSFTTLQITLPTVTTTIISDITTTTATGGGNVTSDGGATVTARGVCWSTNQNPTTADSKTTDGSGTGSFVSSLIGLTPNTTYYVRAYATNSAGTAYGNQVSFVTGPSTISDIDGNTYNVIRIGSQLWMKENLKTTKYNDGTSIPVITDNIAWLNLTTPGYCWYNNDAATYKATYGALYNWYTVNTGKLCPTGWHVPTDAEWTILTDYLGGESLAGGKLKEAGTSHWASPNTGATNETGFTGLPGGYRLIDGTFNLIGNYGIWWSATETDATNAWYRILACDNTYLSRLFNNKQLGFSVRCVRDY